MRAMVDPRRCGRPQGGDPCLDELAFESVAESLGRNGYRARSEFMREAVLHPNAFMTSLTVRRALRRQETIENGKHGSKLAGAALAVTQFAVHGEYHVRQSGLVRPSTVPDDASAAWSVLPSYATWHHARGLDVGWQPLAWGFRGLRDASDYPHNVLLVASVTGRVEPDGPLHAGGGLAMAFRFGSPWWWVVSSLQAGLRWESPEFDDTFGELSAAGLSGFLRVSVGLDVGPEDAEYLTVGLSDIPGLAYWIARAF